MTRFEPLIVFRVVNPTCVKLGSCCQDDATSHRKGFSLIELLVTFFVLTLLAGIALPVTRNAIRDQRNNRATQLVTSFLESTRNQAIAGNHEMGVVFERLSTTDFGRSACIQLRQLRGVPPYTGDSAKADAVLFRDNAYANLFTPVLGNEINAARFDPIDSPLLALSARLLGGTAIQQASSPIKLGDLLELPGGRLVAIQAIYLESNIIPDLRSIVVNFQLRDPANASSPLSALGYPNRRWRETNPPQRVSYKIHRSPVISNSRSFTLPRGTAIDLNYSGFGRSGIDFSPDLSDSTVPAGDIIVLFDSRGQVSRVRLSGGLNGLPTAQLFFCVGDIDGVQGDELNVFNEERRSRANILRNNAGWIVINPASGRVSAAPMAPAVPQASITNIGDRTRDAVSQGRTLALLGDTLE